MSEIITRAQYMENSSELHHDYYFQFVTEATKQFVLNRIGMAKLLASTDGHLNDTATMESGRWIWDSSPINTALLKEAGEQNTPSTHTCVGKAAARWLIDNHERLKKRP